MIAREQQVIAVVDHHVELRIVIGAAAPARLPRRLVHDHALAALARRTAAARPASPAPMTWIVRGIR